MTYPHHRVVLVRAAIKDPEWVLHLTLTPQVCSFEHWELTKLSVIFSTELVTYNLHNLFFHFQVDTVLLRSTVLSLLSNTIYGLFPII